jgi:glyoxylase-like metal-dependent hydrolase (beta-lactamase superfamily II)
VFLLWFTKTSKINENVYLVDVGMHGKLGSTSVFLVKGEKVAVLDTGSNNTVKNLVEGVLSLGIRRDEVAYIMPSHCHFDHAGGAAYLEDEFPKAKVLVSEKDSKRLSIPSIVEKLIEGGKQTFGDPSITMKPIKNFDIVKDGDSVDLGNGVEIQILETLGHSNDHLSFYEPENRFMFVGDAAGIHMPQTKTITPTAFPPEFNLETFVATINKIESQKPETIGFAHFGAKSARDVHLSLKDTVKAAYKWNNDIIKAYKEKPDLEHVTEFIVETYGKQLNEFAPNHARDLARSLVQGFLSTTNKK